MLPTFLWILGCLAGLGALLYVVGVFNHVIRLRKQVERDFANVDVLLKQRWDEIPALVEVCKGYADHERGTFEAIAQWRQQIATGVGLDARIGIENELIAALTRTSMLVESYPDLKANQSFGRVHKRITELEDAIADRRELFNQSTTNYNEYIGGFPTLLLARALGKRPLPVLIAESHERKAPQVELAGAAR